MNAPTRTTDWTNNLAPTSPIGLALVEHIRGAINALNFLDNNGHGERSTQAGVMACCFADALAAIPAQSAVEALAAAIFINNDMDALLNGSLDHVRKDAAHRIQQRAAGLAAWIESVHGMDRSEWRLDHFGSREFGDRLFPCTEIVSID
ncbi:hypothetical protein [Bradyrhizobium sp.]|uniref:hypothetical protein n=1 Tax=Bradyrhizobium sp. TaxID=376 RepID=UPI0039E44271